MIECQALSWNNLYKCSSSCTFHDLSGSLLQKMVSIIWVNVRTGSPKFYKCNLPLSSLSLLLSLLVLHIRVKHDRWILTMAIHCSHNTSDWQNLDIWKWFKIIIEKLICKYYGQHEHRSDYINDISCNKLEY